MATSWARDEACKQFLPRRILLKHNDSVSRRIERSRTRAGQAWIACHFLYSPQDIYDLPVKTLFRNTQWRICRFDMPQIVHAWCAFSNHSCEVTQLYNVVNILTFVSSENPNIIITFYPRSYWTVNWTRRISVFSLSYSAISFDSCACRRDCSASFSFSES